MIAALAAALVVPVGFALSLESTPGWRNPRRDALAADASSLVASSVVVPASTVTNVTRSFSHPVPDAAKLVILGSVLIGLAAAVRRTS